MYYNRKVAYYTLGCKLNFSETAALSRNIEELGFIRVSFSELADYYIINTCSVTENANKKCRNIVRQAKRINSNAKVIVIGCYAQLKPKEIYKIEGVSLVLSAIDKFKLGEKILELESKQDALIGNFKIKEVNTYMPAYSIAERTRSFVKVQDGCDYFCSFCTIPFARGRSRSMSIDKTINLVKEIAATQVKEVVLTGVNIGDFGKSEDGKLRTKDSFFKLLKALDEVNGLERIRISSIEPNLLHTEIIKFVSTAKRIVPHFHIPLQSGSDNLLKSMRRKYSTNLYLKRVETIKKLMPNACIGVDVIVGFPGENEREFLITKQFLEQLDFSYLHVFTYSERPNTKAIEIKNIVPKSLRQARSKELRALSNNKKTAFYKKHINLTMNVLFEAENDEGFMYGFTENYVKVRIKYNKKLINTIQAVKLKHLNKLGTIQGELISKKVSNPIL